jgi:hypothetical protein
MDFLWFQWLKSWPEDLTRKLSDRSRVMVEPVPSNLQRHSQKPDGLQGEPLNFSDLPLTFAPSATEFGGFTRNP